MSLVVQSERFKTVKNPTSSKVGPGCYKELDQFECAVVNKHGFNSTLTRAERVAKKAGPGPGTYQPLVTATPGMSGFMRMVRPSPFFANAMPRFKLGESTPGPGQYSTAV